VARRGGDRVTLDAGGRGAGPEKRVSGGGGEIEGVPELRETGGARRRGGEDRSCVRLIT
jgi:hypothetical protein